MATDRELYRRWIKGQLNPLALSGANAEVQAQNLETLANQVNQKHVTFYKAADAATSTTWATPILYTRTAIKIQYASVLSDSACTTNLTNFASLSLEYDDGAGGSDTQVALLNTNATALTATQKSEMTLASNVDVPASKSLLFKVAKNGAGGVQVNALTLDVLYQEV